MTPRLMLLPLAFALVATVTFASGEGEEAAAAEKEMVLDPSTGEMVTAPEYGGTITFGTRSEPPNSDPGQGHPGAASWWFSNEKLAFADWAIDRKKFGFDSMWIPDFAITGQLAESWEQTDPVTYTVRIRDGVYWHDKAPMNGRQLTAKDVEYNWHRYLGLGSGYTEVNPFVAQWSQLDDIGIESVTATDDRTVVFRLKQPNLAAERTIVYQYTSHIMPPEVIEEHGDLLDWRNLVGTGPYELVDWVQGSSLTFTKNPNYWAFDEKYPDNRLPYIDEIAWLVMPEESTRVAAFRSGQIDYLGSLTFSQIASLDVLNDLMRTNPDTQVGQYYESGIGLAMNLAMEPTNDIRVRQAIQMAIDVETINDGYWQGTGRTTPEAYTAIDIVGYSPPFDEWPEEVQRFYRHDPAEAERLLDDAGYPRGADGIRFKTNVEVRDLYDVSKFEILAEQLLEIGVDIDLQVMPTADWADGIRNHDYQTMTAAPLGNPWGILTPLAHNVSTSGWNPAGVSNAEYDALMAATQNAATVEEQQRASQEALMVILRNHYYVWAGKAANFNVSQPWVKGYNGEYTLAHTHRGTVVARLWLDLDLKKSMGF